MKKLMITMGAVTLASFAATAQELPAPAAALPTPTAISAEQPVAAAEELSKGAECRVYSFKLAVGLNRIAENIKMLSGVLRDNPKGIISKYDDGDEFDGKKMGNTVYWNVASWRGVLTSPEDAAVTFLTTSGETYVISINGTDWSGTGQQTREVALRKGRNDVKIALTRGRRNGALQISYRTTEFGKYEKFTPRNLFHEEQETKGFKLGAW